MPARALDDLPARITSAIQELVTRLRARFGERLATVRLFGSQARGDAGPESDVDLLVLVAGLREPERREVFEIAEEVYFTSLVRLAPLALSTAEYAEMESREYRLTRDIAAEGIAV